MIRVVQADDFTGGLNLEANVFQLASNQSSDMLNVDINPRGGFQRRLGCVQRNASAIGSLSAGSFTPHRLYPWDGEQGKKLMLATDNKVFHSTTGNFTDLGVTSDATYGAEFGSWTTEASSYLYMSLGHGYVPRKWDGTTLTTLTASGTGAWQNDLATPNGTHMPKCEHIAVHNERIWVADIMEGSTHHPNRVRFSHPLFPESWRELDYIDIVGGGGTITAIVPFGGHLLVFKNRAVFAIYGYSEDTFQVVEITRSVGTPNSKGLVATERGVYFFSYPDGMFFYDGKTIRDIFKNVRPMIYDAGVSETALGSISVGYANNKVFLSVPAGSSATGGAYQYDQSGIAYDFYERSYGGISRANRATVSFVWDETVGNGAWTVYRTADGYGFVSPIVYGDNNGNTSFVAVHPYQPYAFNFDVKNTHNDNFTGTPSSYNSYYVMPWQDAGNYVTKKLWRRPEFVLRRETSAVNLDVSVYHDWNAVDVQKSYTVSSEAADTTGLDYSNWNEPDLGSTGVKAHSLGLAKSVQLKISSSTPLPWCVNSIAYKYNPRGVKV